MLSNNIRLALRHLSRKKIYSTVIILSLTTGFACTCLLVSFLISEQKADSFHVNGDRTYELMSSDPFGGTGRLYFTTGPTRDYLENTYPGVENVCMISMQNGSELVLSEDEAAALTAISVDTSFFTLFSFPIESGSKKSLTTDGIMITSQKAKALFGTADVIGKAVTYRTNDTTRLLTITGLIGDAPEKSHLKFDAMVQHRAVAPQSARRRPGGVTYALLAPTQDASELVHAINADSMRPSLMGPGQVEYFLEPISAAYFNPTHKMNFMQSRSELFIWVGWIVCGLVLFMASFNFINLFLLSLQERRKESGIRKTLGISNWQLMKSSATESFIYISVSFVLALGVAYAIMPAFNQTLQSDLVFTYFSKINVLATVAFIVSVLAIMVVLISTSQQRKVPAVSMMRSNSSKVRFSKLLFTAQFFIAITLSVCAFTIIRQMNFLESAPLGFNRNILQIRAEKKAMKEKLPALKNRLLTIPGIDKATLSQGNPIAGNMMMRQDLPDGKFYTPFIFSGDEDFIETLDLKLVAGTTKGTLVNEALVKYFDMKDPVGTLLPGTKSTIAGVVKNFTCGSFKEEIPPAIIFEQGVPRFVLIDYSQTTLASVLPEVRKAWAEIFPDMTFNYDVIQEDLMKKYSEETLFYKIVVAFSITSMIISCFGLFALSWAVIQSRTREMGIRKILGANVADVLKLLTWSFGVRLLVAFVLAAPLGYYLMTLWLSRFVYRAPIDVWVFVVSGVFVVLVATLTLGVQTVKAAVSNPLNEIKE